MNKAPLILAGIFTALFISWYGMVWGPASQQNELVKGDSAYPHDRVGLAKQGAQVYRENGCYHCHSQQVRQGKVLYDIQLTGLGDDKQALKDMMKRNGLKYDSYKNPIDKAYLFKDPDFVQWLTGHGGYLPTLEILSGMAQSLKKELKSVQEEGNATQEFKELSDKLDDPVTFLKELRLDQNISTSIKEDMRNVGDSMDGEVKKAFSKENIDAISAYAKAENSPNYFDGPYKVESDRLLIAKLSGLLTENAKAANAFFGLKTSQTESGTKALQDSISLLPENRVPWSALDEEQDAKRLLAAIKGVGCTANTRAYMPKGAGDPLWSDLQHNWGKRRSVPADYLYDSPVMIGNQRVGPDLANVGNREGKDENWHYRHLYRPRDFDEKSVMPPYPYLFERRVIVNEQTEVELVDNHPNGFVINEDDGTRFFITPKPAARVLVAYLLSLEQKDQVPEAPAPNMEAVAKKETDGSSGSQ